MRARAVLVTVGTAALVAAAPAPGQEPRLSVRHNVEQQELVIEIGPLHLEANAGHHDVSQPRAQALTIPADGYLHGFTHEMIDAEGRTISAMLLHHVNIMAPQRRELFSQIMQRVGAAGSETGDVLIPKFLGYPVSQGDSLLFTSMFHNPTAQSYHNARLRIRMRYTTQKPAIPIMAIQPFYLDVMPPAGLHAYDLPPGRSSRSWEARPALDGRILGVSGHMHKYGVELRFEDVTENKVLWQGKPITDEAGNVIGMPTNFYIWRLGIPIKASNTYRLTAIYDNPTGRTLVQGGMGALGGIIKPAHVPWPQVDRSDPEYLYDVKFSWEGSHGSHGGNGHSGH